MQVQMRAGEKWHFHVDTEGNEAQDPVLYILDACDARTCQLGDAIDRCGSGTDEHLSFVPDRAGSYIVGIDSVGEGGGDYELLALAPVCGNGGGPEHSETCDDGNIVPGDGCDEQCRAELSPANRGEVEPNDEFTESNVVPVARSGESFAVSGRIGGRCDVDQYTFEVEETSALIVTFDVTTSGGCSDSAGLELELLDESGIRALGSGGEDEDGCPVIRGDSELAGELEPGRYHVRLKGNEDASALDYLMTFALALPEGG
jgi:cysteine-rich repeat protein